MNNKKTNNHHDYWVQKYGFPQLLQTFFLFFVQRQPFL